MQGSGSGTVQIITDPDPRGPNIYESWTLVVFALSISGGRKFLFRMSRYNNRGCSLHSEYRWSPSVTCLHTPVTLHNPHPFFNHFAWTHILFLGEQCCGSGIPGEVFPDLGTRPEFWKPNKKILGRNSLILCQLSQFYPLPVQNPKINSKKIYDISLIYSPLILLL